MVRRTSDGRTFRKRTQGDLEGRLDRLEARLERLERKAGLEETEPSAPGRCSGCDDLIGCLDDCITDVGDLRKRVKDVRS